MPLEHSEFLQHEPCPECGSSDALARYSDGHTYCFSCTSHDLAAAPAHTLEQVPIEQTGARRYSANLVATDVQTFTAFKRRGLTEETARKWGYTKGVYRDQTCHVANYRDISGRKVVAQKIRLPGKNFVFLGDKKQAAPLYGMWLWPSEGRMVVVVEGELDALSMSQAQSNRWPVVSVPSGAQGAKKAVAAASDWLEKFDSVVFMFDQDDAGQDAAVQCAALLTPGKAKIAALPGGYKDASDMLQDGNIKGMLDAMWRARDYRPEGLVLLSDLEEEIKKPIELGAPWPWKFLTDATYGRRPGEVYALGAGTGVGKTDFFLEIIAQTIQPKETGGLHQPAAVIYLEQGNAETGRRIASKIGQRPFHIPNGEWTESELNEAVRYMTQECAPCHLYDHFGTTQWDIIRETIRYAVVGFGVKHVFLDHLTALAASEVDERKALEAIMADIAGLAQELGFAFYFISHLATPEGKPHEEGARVTIRHFKGSRAIGFWSHFMFGLERNQQADDPEDQNTTTFRILKDRYTGRSTGLTTEFGYDYDRAMLVQRDGVIPFPRGSSLDHRQATPAVDEEIPF